MRGGYIFLAIAAAFVATSEAAAADSALSKVMSSNVVQSVSSVQNDETKRMLRSDRKTADEEERAVINIKLPVLNWTEKIKDEFAIERLERMLTNQEYKKMKFWVWYRNKESTEDVRKKLEALGAHYKGLADEYFQFKHPKITLYNNVE